MWVEATEHVRKKGGGNRMCVKKWRQLNVCGMWEKRGRQPNMCEKKDEGTE